MHLPIAGRRIHVNTPGSFRVLLVSPVRNEASHIEQVVLAVAAQTRPPDLWLVADDGSDDGTLEQLRRLEQQVPFMRVVALGAKPASGPDRLALALEAVAFNTALAQVDHRTYTHLGKLDGDMELPPDYFERLLAAFVDDPGLGIAGGSIVEPTRSRGAWQPVNRGRASLPTCAARSGWCCASARSWSSPLGPRALLRSACLPVCSGRRSSSSRLRRA